MNNKYYVIKEDEILKENKDEPKKSIIFKFLEKILPKANPDFENIFKNVEKWYLEIEFSNGIILREIGFDKNGVPITISPYKKNYGLWTDSPIIFDKNNKYKEINKEEFDKEWFFLKDILDKL